MSNWDEVDCCIEELRKCVEKMRSCFPEARPLVLLFTRERWGELEGLFLLPEQVGNVHWPEVCGTRVELYETVDEVLAREKVLASEGKEVVVGY